MTQYEYDGLGRRTAVVLPLGQRAERSYDVVGNVVSATDFNGDTILYEYDENNLLTAKRYPDGTSVEYEYTLSGKPAVITDTHGVTRYTYDLQDRMLSHTNPDGMAIHYTYDAVGNVATISTPSGTTRYTYDALNRMETVTDPDGGITRYTYDAAGNLVRTGLPNGVVETRQYDDLNRVIYLQNTDPDGAILSSYRYAIDERGNYATVEEHDGRTVSYTYDDANRLVQEAIVDPVNGNRTISYTYDDVGNRLTRSDSEKGMTMYSYDINDRLLTETLDSVATTYMYDENGNTIATIQDASVQRNYTWNYENRLISAAVTEDSITSIVIYEYAPDGIRTGMISQSNSTKFIVDSNRMFGQVIEEYDSTGEAQAFYVHGLHLHSQSGKSTVTYYSFDGHSGVRLLTDSAGIVRSTYDYDAYGTFVNSGEIGSNRYLYRGEQFEPLLQAQYLRARFYMPLLGRFLSADPFEGLLDIPTTRNSYIYALNNPVMNSDPSGLFTLTDFLVTLSIAGLALAVPQFFVSLLASGLPTHEWKGQTLKLSGTLGEGLARTAGAVIRTDAESKVCTEFDEGAFKMSGSWLAIAGGGSLRLLSMGKGLLHKLPFGISVTHGSFNAESPSILSPWIMAGSFLQFQADSISFAFAKAKFSLLTRMGFATGEVKVLPASIGLSVGSSLFSVSGLDILSGLSIPVPGTFKKVPCTSSGE